MKTRFDPYRVPQIVTADKIPYVRAADYEQLLKMYKALKK